MNTQDKNNQAEAEQIFLESCIALTEVAADLVNTVEEQRRIIDLQRELIKTQGELIKRDKPLIFSEQYRYAASMAESWEFAT